MYGMSRSTFECGSTITSVPAGAFTWPLAVAHRPACCTVSPTCTSTGIGNGSPCSVTQRSVSVSPWRGCSSFGSAASYRYTLKNQP